MPVRNAVRRLFLIEGMYLLYFVGCAFAQDARGPAELRVAGMKEYTLGHFLEARRLLDQAMVLALETNDAYLIALIHDGLGDIYQDEFEFAKAEQEYIKAADILRRQPEHSHALALTLANFAAALSGERRYQEASASLSEASRLVKNNGINDPQLEVQILDGLAMVYFREGQLRKAETLFQRALRLSSLPQNASHPETADVLNNLATLYGVRRNYPKAAAYYLRALDAAEKRLGPNHPSVTTVLVNLGFVYIRMGRYEEAEFQFRRSLAILEDNGLMVSHMGLNTLHGLGRTYAQENELQRAEPLLARAVETGRAIKAQTPQMAEALDLYSAVLRSLSRHREAENLRTEAARIRGELALTTRIGR